MSTRPVRPPQVRTAGARLPGVPEVALGHAWATGDGWASGCTVVLPPAGTVGAVVVGGGAPGTRETDALAPGTLVATVDAVVLSGGSAYGLATADGVMAWCEEDGRGFVVSAPGEPVVRVPIVPAAVLFDLGRGGDPRARPGASFGRAAATAAGAAASAPAGPGTTAPAGTGRPPLEGAVGAGTGARVAGGRARGGLGVAEGRTDVDARGRSWAVTAVVAANAAGVPVGAPVVPVGAPGTHDGPDVGPPGGPHDGPDVAGDVGPAVGPDVAGHPPGLLNTTLVTVVTDAALDPAAARRLAAAAHAGLARAVEPSHTLVDGDVVFVLATGTGGAVADVRARVALEAAAARAVTRAFARAVAPPP